MTFQLIAPTADLVRWSSGSIAGPVWLESNGRCFPEREWSDLSVAVVRGFVHFTRELISAGVGERRDVHFLDGPFSVTLARIDGDCIECSTKGGGRVTDWTAAMPFAQWQESLWTEAKELLNTCIAKGWSSLDLEALTALLDKDSR